MEKCDYELTAYEVKWIANLRVFRRRFDEEEKAIEFAKELMKTEHKCVEVDKVVRLVGWY